MSTLFNIGLSGINAHKRSLEIVGQNLSNASTPGYSRQVAGLQSRSAGVPGSAAQLQGVIATGPRRTADAAITRSLRTSAEGNGYAQARLRVLEETEALAGDPETNAVGTAVDAFFVAAGKLSVDASSIGLRRVFLDSADRLASTLRSAYEDVERIRDQADVRIQASVEETNRLAGRVAELNRQIASSEINGTEAGDLRDERDRALNALSDLAGVRVIESDRGMLDVQTADGHQLVAGIKSFTFTTEADPSNGGHLRIRASDAPGQPIVQGSRLGGAIGGAIAGRDGALVAHTQALDDLAFDLAAAVNTTLAGGTDLDGNAGVPLFDAGASRTGAAGVIQLDARIRGQPRALAIGASSAPGDNTGALAIVGLETQGFVGAGNDTPADAVATAIFTLASDARSAREDAETKGLVFEETQALRESLLGVSMDEELVAMTEAQRAFQASAKIIEAADQVAQEIIGLKR